MLTVSVSIPEINGAGTPYPLPKLYAWFAYFWTDEKTLSSGPTPIAVNVPASGNTRNAFLNVAGEDFTAVPADLGGFSVKLDDSDGKASFGVIVLVLGQYDTPDNAIASGYSTFRTSIGTQLNILVPSALENGGSLDPQQISALTSAISSGVKSAIKASLSDWDKFLSLVHQEKADVYLGSSYIYLNHNELLPPTTAPVSRIDVPLQLPPTADHVFTFPFATITVIPGNQVVANCSAQVKALASAQSALARLEKQLQADKAKKPTTTKGLEAVRHEITELENVSIPAAIKSVSQAEAALQLCRSSAPAGRHL